MTVSGTTTPRAKVVVESWGTLSKAIVSTTADASGAWSVPVTVGFGPATITATSTLGRSTGYAQTSVTNALVPGTTVFSATDPTGDDNGPGTYGYPTSDDFKPGAFDLEGMQVNQTATDVFIQFKLGDLTPTFGSNFGAQLLDLYVRDPSKTATSTAAPFATRNYTIAPDDAWSQRLEVQGFADPVWVDASGNTVGSAQFVVDSANATATIMVPTAQFGTVGSGWKFTVALTGQDGFSPDQARAFAPTPQPFEFGVCQSGNASPICAVDPATVPKVVDTITPDGVSQATELDPTQGPVMLHGVTVPK